jgi:signal peptidase I
MQDWLKQNRPFVVFLLCFAFFRTAIAEWNPIPSGSMRPTLLEGDVVLVNRLAYDFKIPLTDISLAAISDPQRGDVVTFISPKNGVRLIKRIVAIPGDVVELRNEVLRINGKDAEYAGLSEATEPMTHGIELDAIRATEKLGGASHTVQFLPAVSARRDFGPLTVPDGSYFALGDNRDNSEDSRFIGFVPRHLIIGHAHRIIVSANIKGNWLPRMDRIGAAIR